MNHLIIWKETSLFLGSNNTDISEHQHPMIQLILCVNDLFLWKDTNGSWIKKKALLISPNQVHECNALGKEIIIIGVDPESIFGQFIINEHLLSESIIDFPSSCLEKLNIIQISKNIMNKNWAELYSAIKLLFGFKFNKFALKKKDERIKNVLDFISNNIHSKITTEILTNVAYLSESRLIHLFKQEMGLPIRNYILWHRLQLAFIEITKGHSLTKVAYLCGFSDQSHLTRTFVKVIGATPSSLLKNSKFIQVSFPL
jgi:AraC-like DNA-binding protein